MLPTIEHNTTPKKSKSFFHCFHRLDLPVTFTSDAHRPARHADF